MDIIKAATVKEKKIMMEDDPLRLPIFCIMLQAFILCFVLIVLAPFHKKLPVTIVPEWSIRFLALIGNASYLQLDEKKLHAKPSKACTPPPGVQAILMKWPTQIIRWFERDSSFSRRICVSQNFHPRNELTML